MRQISLIIVFSIFILQNIYSQNSPDIELRATWFTTVSNLDWPNKYDKGDVQAQKSSFIQLIESLNDININTIFLQVRTECDAFYNSDYEPWSRYLTGIQGKNPGYDPLQFAIDECHKRGIEVHAWLNPYRINVSTYDNGNYYAPENVYKQHPDWALVYSDGKKILNPGLTQVQNYIKKIVGDIINKYDVDGIHFDDYFYSYSGTPTEMDLSTYTQYGNEYDNIGDFRRGSINKMIRGVMDTILAVKPFVRFGVSPFGIYGNGQNPPGISGLDAYNVIYCDPIAWLNEGSVDYINPQLYWPTGGSQDFGKLLPWWADRAFNYNRDVFAGHAIYRLDDYPAGSYHDFGNPLHEYKEYFNLSNIEIFRAAGWSLEEIVRQINIVRQNDNKNALGSVFFRTKDFERVHNLKEYLHQHVYQHKSLLPEQYWKQNTKPQPVTNIRFEFDSTELKYKIKWDGGDSLSRYAIYLVDSLTQNYNHSNNLIDISFDNYYIPASDTFVNNAHIGIVKINRFWNTSEPSQLFAVPKPEKPILVSPENNYENMAKSGVFTWKVTKNAVFYTIEFSEDSTFTQIYESHTTGDTFFYANDLYLNGETMYFWRVRAKNIGGSSEYSNFRTVTTGFPAIPVFIYPQNNEDKVGLNPKFRFEVSPKTDSLHLQITRGGTKFNMLTMIIDTVFAKSDTFLPLNSFYKNSAHYCRIRAKNDFGTSPWSEIIKFKTIYPLPEITEITSPENNSVFDEGTEKIDITWNKAKEASFYLLQISDKQDFSYLLKDESVYIGEKYSYFYPEKKKWLFTRVAGENIGGIAPWSEPVRFILDNSIGINEIKNEENDVVLFPNPCEDKCYLKFNDFEQNLSINIDIFDISGKVLNEINVVSLPESNILYIDLKQLNCSSCFIRITNKNYSKTLKFFKIK